MSITIKKKPVMVRFQVMQESGFTRAGEHHPEGSIIEVPEGKVAWMEEQGVGKALLGSIREVIEEFEEDEGEQTWVMEDDDES